MSNLLLSFFRHFLSYQYILAKEYNVYKIHLSSSAPIMNLRKICAPVLMTSSKDVIKFDDIIFELLTSSSDIIEGKGNNPYQNGLQIIRKHLFVPINFKVAFNSCVWTLFCDTTHMGHTGINTRYIKKKKLQGLELLYTVTTNIQIYIWMTLFNWPCHCMRTSTLKEMISTIINLFYYSISFLPFLYFYIQTIPKMYILNYK